MNSLVAPATEINQPYRRYSPAEQIAALMMGSIGLLVLGLQPILLGALLSEGKVDFDGLAAVATCEILAIGAGSVLFVAIFSVAHMRGKSLLLLVLAVIGHLLTPVVGGLMPLVLLRGATGLVEGGLVAIAIEMVARTLSPPRSGALFVFLQTFLQSLLALVLALVVIPRFGSDGGFVALAAASGLGLFFLPLLPDRYGALEGARPHHGPAGNGPAAMAALLSIFCLYLFIGALWAFLEPLGGHSGLDPASVGLIVSICLLAQMAGALVAMGLERQLGYRLVVGVVALFCAAIGLAMAQSPAPALFWGLSLATGFLWLFVVPWQISMTMAADESRKTALLVPAAQLFGAALGPAGASAFIAGADYRGVALFAAASAAASLAFLGLVVLAISMKRNG